MPIRPPSSVCMAILKPLPSLPSRFSLGTTQSSKIRSQVELPRIPIFFSCLPVEKPGKSFSTMKAEMPWLPLVLSVMAKTTKVEATLPLVMKHLEPLST